MAPTDATDTFPVRRRSFLSLLAVAAGGGAAGVPATASDGERDDELEALSFYSTASQVDANYEPLTDDEHVVAWASPDAYVTIASDWSTDPDDVTEYGDDRIPLVSRDGNVLGIGSAGFVSDERGGFARDNEQFLLNVWDELMGPGSTVLWDESHNQHWDLAAHDVFRNYAEANGYELAALESFDDGDDGLEFYSTASQVDADGGALAADEHVLVWAEGTATNVDRNGDGAYRYGEDERIPLVSRDGSVVGLGAPLVEDASDHDENVAFLLAVWDDLIDGDAVVWDESHDQYYGTWRFGDFIAEAEDEGYDVSATDDLLETLDAGEADAVVVTTPERPFSGDERAALVEFVADGGAVFLHDQSEFGGHDRTDNLNEIADALDLAFRFNADQVEDDATGWDDFVFTTTAVDEAYAGDVGDGIGLEDADGVVITTPQYDFWESELEALEEFVAGGGALFLFDQSDFGGHDRTDNLNAVADALDLAFRFNGGQVEDEVQNDGPEYVPIATEFAGPSAYLADRPGVGIDFEAGKEYYGRVVRVFDGDTVEVEFDSEFGHREVVRLVGIDTAETPPAENDTEEWFGIPESAYDHLYEWGANATEFALDALAPDGAEAGEQNLEGRHVRLTFDPVEPLRGNYGRLLMNLYYDPDEFAVDFETGDFSASYVREAVAEGYARVYSSGFSTHDELAALEEEALAAGRGIWSAADFDALSEIRNYPVEKLFVPSARSVRSARGRDGGRLGEDRVPVYAADTTVQKLGEGGVAYDDVPLVGVDERRRVAAVGGLAIHERYEEREGFVDTSGYGNFPFLANLVDSLSEATGDVVIAGGQGQFNAAGSISLERCQYFLRYLEGVGTRLRQVNDLAGSLPAEAETPRAVLVTAPARELEMDEIIALRRYRNAGGAVILLGSADADPEHVANLNRLAWRLNTDLRFNEDALADETNNVGGEPAVLETTRFNEAFSLFDAYDPARLEADEPPRGRARAADD